MTRMKGEGEQRRERVKRRQFQLPLRKNFLTRTADQEWNGRRWEVVSFLAEEVCKQIRDFNGWNFE